MTKDMTHLQSLVAMKGISSDELKVTMRLKSGKSVYNKLSRVTDLLLPEAKAVHDRYFPEYSFNYLFDGYFGWVSKENEIESN